MGAQVALPKPLGGSVALFQDPIWASKTWLLLNQNGILTPHTIATLHFYKEKSDILTPDDDLQTLLLLSKNIILIPQTIPKPNFY